MIPALADALAERGYDTLTPVQEAVTDAALSGADLLVSAQTGSGKTVGFGLAIAPTLLGDADRFDRAGAPAALVVAPTRELAFQVMQELKWLYARTGAVVASCVGGMDVRQERRSLERGAHIVVGTPGRLCDHIRRGALDLSDVKAVVLDEADEMLDLGFREDLEFILGEAPEERRTLLFSATVSPTIARLAEEFQKDAQRINTIDKAAQHADIAYKALRVAVGDEDHAIFNLLRFHDEDAAIVFANTRAGVNHLAARLTNRGMACVSLSGELSQQERTHALQAMRDGRARVCVATDVAARGIDLPNLSLVIHADLPQNTESLLHRSGRTGRAGRKGVSALIVTPRTFRKAERLLGWAKISADWTVPPGAEDIVRHDEEKMLTAPSWSEPPTEEEAEFAKRLLEKHSPEAAAVALLRLHRERNAAPEDLQDPDARPPKKERQAFGPSRWYALSVGRNERAEPRWLLPLVLRATDLDKAAIGAIRVRDEETFLEIAEGAAAKFEGALGADGELADGILARPSEAPQGGGPRGPGGPGGGGRGPGGPRGGKPHRGRRDDAGPRGGGRGPGGGGKPRGKPNWDGPRGKGR
ncbi:DEAD/DEAH box helicase [Rhodovulum sp. DZ06]|uniref:DEAD/DEAH box helicase n=1 Tax=Rhodovulum sp. DZ06 TaxID=3425126 RepID=UPI003D34719B